ncbi:hypothetical protein ACQJ0K_11445 [Priestia megaterium]|uniref:hypothetical protein n=1 Tax=Priestia megaterium TaxID=1404 RepID=UPI003CFA5ECD
MDPEQQLNKDPKLCTRWALGLTFLFVLLFPGVMFLTGYQYTLSFFKGWTYFAFGWLIIAGICIIVGPVVEFVREKKERDTV